MTGALARPPASVADPGSLWLSSDGADPVDRAALLAELRAAGESVATAESLTGGLLCAALTDPAGASDVVRGGIVAYHGDLKTDLVGVRAELLAEGGAVQAEVAEELAAGVRERLSSTWGLATTGVAGPAPSDGREVGTVFVGLAGPGVRLARELHLTGGRGAIRAATVEAALGMLAQGSRLLHAGVAVDPAGARGPGVP